MGILIDYTRFQSERENKSSDEILKRIMSYDFAQIEDIIKASHISSQSDQEKK